MVEINIGQGSSGFWNPQIIAAMIGGLIALITGSVVGVIAWRQWKTAKDKLALDLFDRRFDAFSLCVGAIGRWHDHLQRVDSFRLGMDGIPNDITEDILVSAAKIHFMFGRDVEDALKATCLALEHMGAAKSEPGFEVVDLAWTVAVAAWEESSTRLFRLGDRYMMMGHISVNRPTKPSMNRQ